MLSNISISVDNISKTSVTERGKPPPRLMPSGKITALESRMDVTIYCYTDILAKWKTVSKENYGSEWQLQEYNKANTNKNTIKNGQHPWLRNTAYPPNKSSRRQANSD